jgi:hypothetical protein
VAFGSYAGFVERSGSDRKVPLPEAMAISPERSSARTVVNEVAKFS